MKPLTMSMPSDHIKIILTISMNSRVNKSVSADTLSDFKEN
jgi:hypothetical protein